MAMKALLPFCCLLAVVADDCTVQLIEESMVGSVSGNFASECRPPENQQDASCIYECMKEIYLLEMSATSAFFKPTLKNCSSNATFRCPETHLTCSRAWDTFPNACSGKLSMGGHELALAFYSYSAERQEETPCQ